MKIEQIVAYLLVSTVIVIFSMLVLFTMMSSVGNGGEYWGYDGKVHPVPAATEAFGAGDYRLLDVDLPPYEGEFTDFVPGVVPCDGTLTDYLPGYRRSSSEPLHAEDSLRLATDFAAIFNDELAYWIGSENKEVCAFRLHH